MFIIQEPSANVAITHDSQWSLLFEKVCFPACLIESRPNTFGYTGTIEARGP